MSDLILDSNFQLNPNLNVTELAKGYAHSKRYQVQNFLTDSTANLLYECLATQVPWGIAYQSGEKPIYHRAEVLNQLSQAEQNDIDKIIHEGALNGFQYAYNTYPVLDAYIQKWGQVPLLDRFLEYINSAEVLSFVRELTGRQDIIKGDLQACRYGARHYLKAHTDDVKEESRVCAFVINLTPKWDRDWGGYLQFYNQSGDIEQAFLPRFNVLNIFTVPQSHSVSYVANYCPESRYTLTGWFRFN